MKWYMFFLLLSGIFLSPRTSDTVAVLIGIMYLVLAVIAGWRDE